MTPINYKGEGTHEQAYVLNTKGKLMAVVEDGQDVLLTNAGKLTKTDTSSGHLEIIADEKKNTYKSFVPAAQAVVERKPMPSIGEGTEIVIGMEKGRFTKEIIASIKEFVRKIETKEIVLPQFVAAPNAKDTQLIMLAGGFGSRAEYTNASSSAIFHDKEGGAQSTKGVFRTATGLTPMETTFVTLHKAGLLDCSKGKIGIDKNIKFYLNEGQNRGNGEFSADLYASMSRDGRKSAIIFPNDSMSRMTNAVIEANELIGSGKAAIAMVAKKVKAEDCIKNFGIIKYDPETKQILDFAEKPSKEELYGKYADFIDKDGMCVTNTFQFAVSDEAFQVLNMLEDLFIPKVDPKTGKVKETRDWSSQYVPIIKTLTQENDYEVIKKQLAKSLNNKPEAISDSLIANAKALLGNQNIYTIPTTEPWADCGTLNQLYHTTMQIVSGDFPLEDFERAHALECVDTSTGLVASSKSQKERIASKYTIDGQVMVVPQARAVSFEEVADIPVTYHLD
jgi:Tfp pilus assembly protein PilZ